MRNRRKTYTNDVLENSRFITKEPQPDKWVSPIHLEIGTGKGSFIKGMSEKYPNINFVGIEKEREIIVMAARLLESSEKEQKNVKLIHGSATDLFKYFSVGQISRIYLNFSDPWPKTRNAKRRLTHRTFLDNYKKILKEEGEVHFKTDNMDLFDFSLLEFKEMSWEQIYNTRDLHKEEFHTSGENITTEYEKRFSDMGQPIYRACFKKP